MLNDFKKIVTARFLFTFAVELQSLLLGWRMYELTGSKWCLGLIGLSEAVPAIGMALYAGYVVDRSRPLVVFRWVILGSLLSGLILFGSQLPAFELASRAQVIALFAASFVTGAARSFSQPAMYAILPRLIGRGELARASAWMTTAMQFARISGPALGGIIFGRAGMAISAGVVCGVLLLALVFVALIVTRIDAPGGSARGALSDELLSGARFVFGHPILLPALSLDMISVLFGGVSGLLPVFARDILHVGPDDFGMLRSAGAVGAGLMSVVLARRGIRRHAGAWLFTAVGGFGVSILVFGLSKNFYLSAAALAFSGAFDSISVIVRSTAVQLASPDHMRGRISAVNSIFIGSSNEIGEFESGVAASLIGTVPSVIFGGGMCLLTVLGAAIFFPALRKLDLGAMEAAHRVEPG